MPDTHPPSRVANRGSWGSWWTQGTMDYLLFLGHNASFQHSMRAFGGKMTLILGMASETKDFYFPSPNIFGINIFMTEMENAKRLSTGVHLILAGAEDLPFRNSVFNCVVCKSTLHHLSNTTKGIAETARVLEDGGHFVLYEPGLMNPLAMIGRKWFPSNIHIETEKAFIFSTLEKCLSNYLEIMSSEYFFIFLHAVPIILRHMPRLRVFFNKKTLRILAELDNRIAKKVKNLSWSSVIVARKQKSRR